MTAARDPAVAAAWARLADLAELQAERDAIQGEPALPPPGTAERECLDIAQQALLTGLLAAASRP